MDLIKFGRPRPLLPLGLSLLIGLGLACGPLDPQPIRELTLVTNAESGRFYLLEVRLGSVVASSEVLPRHQDVFAFSPDSSVLYFTAFEEPLPAKELTVLDPWSMEVLWREPLSAIAARSTIGPLLIFGSTVLTPSSDGSLLLLDGDWAGTPSVVVVGADSREPVRFIGSLTAAPISVTVGSDAIAPRGAVVIGGRRDPQPAAAPGWLFRFDGETLDLLDSIAVTAPTDDQWGGLRQALMAPGLRYLYSGSPGQPVQD